MAVDPGVLPWLMCRAGSYVCALPLAGIKETMRPLPIEPFPNAPTFITGLAVIRGEATPVVDLAALLGETRRTTGRFVTMMAKDSATRTGDGRQIALAVDAVLGIRALERVITTGLPPLLKDIAGAFVSAVAARDEQLLLFLETARILPPSIVDALASAKEAS